MYRITIPHSIIAKALLVITIFLTRLFNSFLANGIFPPAWERARIIALKKIPVPSSSFDFRPMALLCFLSKVLEKLPSDEVVNFLATKNILDSFPTGFRKFHNTQTVLLKLIDDIQVGGEIGLPPSCCNFTLVKPSTKYNRLGFSRS